MATTSSTLWNAVVLRIGKGAQDMLDTGVIVLFGEPVPAVSYTHLTLPTNGW